MAKTRRTTAQWQTLIDQLPESGLTTKAYCQQHNVSLSCFYQWRSKLTKTDIHLIPSSEDDWYNVPSEPLAQTHWDIELSLPNGVILRMKHS